MESPIISNKLKNLLNDILLKLELESITYLPNTVILSIDDGIEYRWKDKNVSLTINEEIITIKNNSNNTYNYRHNYDSVFIVYKIISHLI